MSELRFSGRWQVLKYRAGASEPYEVSPLAGNTLTLTLVLDLITGASADHVDATSDLEVRSSTDVLLTTLTSMDTGFPDHSTSKQVVMQWKDSSGTGYNGVDKLIIKTPTGAVFSTVSGLALGDKPAGETWAYKYTLTISNGGDTSLQDAGLDLCLRLVTGNSASHLDNAGTKCQITTAGDVEVGLLSCDAGFPTRTGTTVKYEFTAGASVANGAWDKRKVRQNAAPTLIDVYATSAGTKASGESWTYEWSLSAS